MKAFSPNTDRQLVPSHMNSPPALLNNEKYPNSFLPVESWIMCGSTSERNCELPLTGCKSAVITVIPV